MIIQVEKLERDYRASLDSLERQKSEAKRWLLRQQVRLQAQAEEVQREKAAIAEILEADMTDLHLLLKQIDSYKQ